MATTTNFGWETPDDTDLVKDGALAIRTLGSAIDTSLVDLKGGTTGQVLSKTSDTDMDFTWVTSDDANAIQNAIVDAKGDLITATAADTPARLAVGANDQVLTADSTTSTGLKWATPSSGGMTLLSTTTLSGSSTTISSISGSYTSLYLIYTGIQTSSDNSEIWIRFNSDTGTNYDSVVFGAANTTFTTNLFNNESKAIIGKTTSDGASFYKGYGQMTINQYTSTSTKVFNGANSMRRNTNADIYGLQNIGQYRGSSAISSITFTLNTGTYSAGTVYLYGVK